MYQCQIVRTWAEVVGSQPRAHLLQCSKLWGRLLLEAQHFRDFPGGPVARTPHSECRGPRLGPWSGN